MREPQSKAIENCSPGYRVYCTNKENEVMLLLIAGDKSRRTAGYGASVSVINNPDARSIGAQCSMFRTVDRQAIGRKVNSLSKCKFRLCRNLTG